MWWWLAVMSAFAASSDRPADAWHEVRLHVQSYQGLAYAPRLVITRKNVLRPTAWQLELVTDCMRHGRRQVRCTIADAALRIAPQWLPTDPRAFDAEMRPLRDRLVGQVVELRLGVSGEVATAEVPGATAEDGLAHAITMAFRGAGPLAVSQVQSSWVQPIHPLLTLPSAMGTVPIGGQVQQVATVHDADLLVELEGRGRLTLHAWAKPAGDLIPCNTDHAIEGFAMMTQEEQLEHGHMRIFRESRYSPTSASGHLELRAQRFSAFGAYPLPYWQHGAVTRLREGQEVALGPTGVVAMPYDHEPADGIPYWEPLPAFRSPPAPVPQKPVGSLPSVIKLRIPTPVAALYDDEPSDVCVRILPSLATPHVTFDEGRFRVWCRSDDDETQACVRVHPGARWPERFAGLECEGPSHSLRIEYVPGYDPHDDLSDGVTMARSEAPAALQSVLFAAFRAPGWPDAQGRLFGGRCEVRDERLYVHVVDRGDRNRFRCELQVVDDKGASAIRTIPVRVTDRLRVPPH